MGQVLWTLCCGVGYVMTYGAFGTDPPTPFGVGGLNSQSGAKYRTLPSANDLSNLIRHDVICNCFNRMIPGQKKGFAGVLWFFRIGF